MLDVINTPQHKHNILAMYSEIMDEVIQNIQLESHSPTLESEIDSNKYHLVKTLPSL